MHTCLRQHPIVHTTHNMTFSKVRAVTCADGAPRHDNHFNSPRTALQAIGHGIESSVVHQIAQAQPNSQWPPGRLGGMAAVQAAGNQQSFCIVTNLQLPRGRGGHNVNDFFTYHSGSPHGVAQVIDSSVACLGPVLTEFFFFPNFRFQISGNRE